MADQAANPLRKTGFWQIVLVLLGFAAQSLWFAKGEADQSQANIEATAALRSTLNASSAQLTQRMDSMSEALNRLALAQERLNEHMAQRDVEIDRRLKRLEDLRDGDLYRGKHE